MVRLTETLALGSWTGRTFRSTPWDRDSIHTQMWDELRDGAEAAGATRIYELGQQVTSGGGATMASAVDLAVWLASDASGALSGRLISATADDWTGLQGRIPEVHGLGGVYAPPGWNCRRSIAEPRLCRPR